MRLRELAGCRVRHGYRRLTVLLKREGWPVNAKRIYRLYTEEGLIVRTQSARSGRSDNASHKAWPRGLTNAGAWISSPSGWRMGARSECRR